MATLKDLIQQYVDLRRKKTELAEQQKEAMAPYNSAMMGLENVFMAEMDKAGVDSVSARDVGTIYRSTRSTVTVADFEALKAFVLEHGAWELLQARANAPAVEAYLEDTGELPPGINLNRILKINVRKD